MPWVICANVCTIYSLDLHQLMIQANQNYRNFTIVITIQAYDKNRLTIKSILTWRNYISPFLAVMALTLEACSIMHDANYRRYAVTFVENHDTQYALPIHRTTLLKEILLQWMLMLWYGLFWNQSIQGRKEL